MAFKHVRLPERINSPPGLGRTRSGDIDISILNLDNFGERLKVAKILVVGVDYNMSDRERYSRIDPNYIGISQLNEGGPYHPVMELGSWDKPLYWEQLWKLFEAYGQPNKKFEKIFIDRATVKFLLPSSINPYNTRNLLEPKEMDALFKTLKTYNNEQMLNTSFGRMLVYFSRHKISPVIYFPIDQFSVFNLRQEIEYLSIEKEKYLGLRGGCKSNEIKILYNEKYIKQKLRLREFLLKFVKCCEKAVDLGIRHTELFTGYKFKNNLIE